MLVSMIGALDHRDFDVGVGRLREAPHRRATQGKLLGAAAFGGPEDAQGWTTGVCGMGVITKSPMKIISV